MASDRANRRRFLQVGGAALTTMIAGCESASDSIYDDDDAQEQTETQTEVVEQEYEIPPVGDMLIKSKEGENINIDVVYKPLVEGYEERKIYFQDDITFELFVYDTYPVGNDINLEKLTEETKSPYEKDMTALSFSYKDIPKNTSVRYRLKITNERTGKSEWAMDKSMGYRIDSAYGPYEYVYGDMKRIVINPKENETQYDFVKRGDKYVKGMDVFAGFRDDRIADIPFTRESFKQENGLYDEDSGPTCSAYNYEKIELSVDDVKAIRENSVEELKLQEGYNTLTHNGWVSDNKEVYDVLDNKACQRHADVIINAQEDYGVKNHHSRIWEAARLVRGSEYDRRRGGVSIPQTSIHLPGPYWVDRVENCVGHTYNLIWLLYHMGYTAGTVYINRSGQGTPNHLGVGIPVPEEVMKSDFPEEYPSAFKNSESDHVSFVEGQTKIFRNKIDDIGEDPWLYIETTGAFQIGVQPFDEVDHRGVQYVLEPEDNVFGTNLKNQTGS